jgi:hypothetical protein
MKNDFQRIDFAIFYLSSPGLQTGVLRLYEIDDAAVRFLTNQGNIRPREHRVQHV